MIENSKGLVPLETSPVSAGSKDIRTRSLHSLAAKRCRKYQEGPRKHTKEEQKTPSSEANEPKEKRKTKNRKKGRENRVDREKTEPKKSILDRLLDFLFAKKKAKALKEYPKNIPSPVDIEVVEGEENFYFNIEKWLAFRKFDWIKRIIPIHILDKLFYNRAFFDKKAKSIHEKSVRYNALPAEEQYEEDRKITFYKWSALFGVFLFFFFVMVFSIVPSYQSNRSLALMRQGEYQKAYESFSGIHGRNKLDDFYRQYSFAMGHMQAKNYEKAKEELRGLEGYEADYVDLNEAMNEILYEEAEDFYKKGEYAKAANNLTLTYHYKDSKNRFLEASYMSLDELMNEASFEEAMKMLSLLGSYKDSEEKGREFMESLYQKAKEKYANGDFEEAGKLFYCVAQNDYKDSKTMIYQAQYNAGLSYYQQKNYDKAIEQLSKISWFKDSSAMLYDMYYQKGKIFLEENPVKAYDSFMNCVFYRDTLSFLTGPSLALYGEWSVESYDGSIVKDVGLTFSFDNCFTSSQKDSRFLKDFLLSSEKEENPYTFRDGSYVDKNGQSKITVLAKDINSVTLSIKNEEASHRSLNSLVEETSHSIGLVRVKPIERANLDIFSSIRDSLYEYIDKKLEKQTTEETQ